MTGGSVENLQVFIDLFELDFNILDLISPFAYHMLNFWSNQAFIT